MSNAMFIKRVLILNSLLSSLLLPSFSRYSAISTTRPCLSSVINCTSIIVNNVHLKPSLKSAPSSTQEYLCLLPGIGQNPLGFLPAHSPVPHDVLYHVLYHLLRLLAPDRPGLLARAC